MQWHSDLFKFDLSVPKIWGHCIGHMGLSLPGAIEVCEEVTLRLMLRFTVQSLCALTCHFIGSKQQKATCSNSIKTSCLT